MSSTKQHIRKISTKYLIASSFLALLVGHNPCFSSAVDTLMAEKKYTEALDVLESSAKKGDAEVQNKLGELYHFGPEDVRNFTKAKEWYLRAVEAGSGEAANHLGRLYTNGEGVEKNLNKATYWYQKGMSLGSDIAERNYYSSSQNSFYFVLDRAMLGDPEALFVAASFYHFGGVGIRADLKKAHKLYEKSSLLGFQEASKRLAQMYLNGEGVKADSAKAKQWEEMANKQREEAEPSDQASADN